MLRELTRGSAFFVTVVTKSGVPAPFPNDDKLLDFGGGLMK